MSACPIWCRCRLPIVCTVLALVTLGSSALAQPRQNHSMKEMKNYGAVREQSASLQEILQLDDAAKARGGVSSGSTAEAVIFDQPNDSGFGWFMKNDDVFGYGTWAAEMIFANGFAPGDSVSSYHMRFFHSAFDDIAGLGGNDAHVTTQLWDGDPFSIMDTGCTVAGVSAPIAGTQASFSGIPWGTAVDLTAVLATKVQVDCNRVWGEMTMVLGCRGAWRLSGKFAVSAFTVPANVGQMNGVWLLYACEQFGLCDTPNGNNVGTCCNAPLQACDHTDGTFECDVNNTAPGGLPSFCGDGAADYFLADYHNEGVFEGYVATVSAATDTFLSMVVVSVDAPPASGGSAEGVISLSDEEVVLAEGDHNVWVEFRIGDWDPDDQGVQLSSWGIKLDPASYKSGSVGALTAYTGGPFGTNCTGPDDDAPCVEALGPGAICDPPGYSLPLGTCSFGFIDQARDDFVMKLAGLPICTVDLSLGFPRPACTTIGGAADDPEPFPEGDLYAATVTLHVPADAKGSFTISFLDFPTSQLVDQDSMFIPLLGFKPTKITIPTGRCCFNTQNLTAAGCTDILQTQETCAQLPGLTFFEVNGTCADECPNECIADPEDPDCNSDGIKDECEPDCDKDGVPDPCELIPFGVQRDCNGNTVPDDCDIASGSSDDCNGNGIPDDCEPDCDDDGVPDLCVLPPFGSETDCNGNSVPDVCDIASEVIEDCDSNGTPDPCEVPPFGSADDCNGNQIPDDCDLDSGSSTDCNSNLTPDDCEPDCNGNGIPNDCDLTAGTSLDLDDNGVPDECECPPAAPQHVDPIIPKNRFLSLRPGNFGQPTAIRVMIVDLAPPFDIWSGAEMWVGPPSLVNEIGALVEPTPGSETFWAATLTCTPHYMDFGALGTIHVFHEAVLPNGLYEVDEIDEICGDLSESNFSLSISMANPRWGDVLEDFTTDPPKAPEGTVRMLDLLGIIGRFGTVPGSIIKSRADLEPGCLDLTINITDVFSALTGFQGLGHPFEPSADDPCQSECMDPLP